jgi:hypothetical protein
MLAKERRGELCILRKQKGDISTLRIWVTFQLWVYTSQFEPLTFCSEPE